MGQADCIHQTRLTMEHSSSCPLGLPPTPRRSPVPQQRQVLKRHVDKVPSTAERVACSATAQKTQAGTSVSCQPRTPEIGQRSTGDGRGPSPSWSAATADHSPFPMISACGSSANCARGTPFLCRRANRRERPLHRRRIFPCLTCLPAKPWPKEKQPVSTLCRELRVSAARRYRKSYDNPDSVALQVIRRVFQTPVSARAGVPCKMYGSARGQQVSP